MGTSVTSTGITFPDATTQTTAASSAFAAGTKTNFFNASAPTGWTQCTTYNDYALRIVSGTGGGVGGSTAFSTVFANQTPTITTSGLSAAATTLTTTQMPSHGHNFVFRTSCNYAGGSYLTSNGCASLNYAPNTNASVSSSVAAAGSGGSHTHSISGSATSSAITLNVYYQNHILCTKS